MEQRLTELEIRLTHQEVTLDALSRSLTEQQKTLDNMLVQVDYIKSVLVELVPGAAESNSHEPPPHY